ncbi:16S rRNA (cytidine(1402)-2'-O)-methyltransferase [Mycoplasmopsis gallopavonis]|uniref:Ribosomal RNA small subunit methyltransferase I n=1 Tax=Mycoplasmopsis gallopavonis TaxID=76629 RepID=A0A449AZK3_9BACT|nr:16S rRNA (cytidine(1402)-2'-O)-methyltransferase [Mycoplasmopsis gallopavonis]RIV16707.1 16S rRNA (cytidine(1402)-2'-O)-methyltransferase [Mycoplasmopsis gallopavonis]VEU72931.1 putative SAM-dependent methyltransferase [Mycoplasmopsis gallopavonis]
MNKLYVVGTPIGNLEDITLRALRILKEVNYIACEDTRVTRKLLGLYEIQDKKLLTYNNFTEKNSAKGLLKILEQGENLAVVSDAGMPVMSDPGFEIIKQARLAGYEIEIIPGVNAAVTAFVGSSFNTTFTFMGFMKDKSQQRLNSFENLQVGTYVYYVSPHKLINSLQDLETFFQDQVQICLAKELTKMHETWFFGTPKEILEQLQEVSVKGEFTLVLNLPKVKRVKVSKYAKNS